MRLGLVVLLNDLKIDVIIDETIFADRFYL